MLPLLVGDFFAAAFLCNCIPHVLAGLLGMPFPTPFAKPHGVGDSSPMVNFVWGFVNLLVGIVLLIRFPAPWGFNLQMGVMFFAVGLLGLGMSRHFGRVQASKR